MMRPYADKVESDPSVPAAVDIVVIGGGIVGCSAAFWAAEQGHRVALIEKGRIAGEQSMKDDNMGFSFHITTIYEGTETHIHYQNHLESN